MIYSHLKQNEYSSLNSFASDLYRVARYGFVDSPSPLIQTGAS